MKSVNMADLKSAANWLPGSSPGASTKRIFTDEWKNKISIKAKGRKLLEEVKNTKYLKMKMNGV